MDDMIVLREFERVAHEVHWCDTCCQDIHPGELYLCTVYVFPGKKRHRILVLKQHRDPVCEPPPDPNDKWEVDEWETKKWETKPATEAIPQFARAA